MTKAEKKLLAIREGRAETRLVVDTLLDIAEAAERATRVAETHIYRFDPMWSLIKTEDRRAIQEALEKL